MADTIGSNIRVAGNMLLHSFRTAAPCWAAIALVAVILIIRAMAGKKKGKKHKNADEKADKKPRVKKEKTKKKFSETDIATMPVSDEEYVDDDKKG